MHGLLRYLAGPGRANEHSTPHVISGDAYLQAWHGSEELDGRSAAAIATYLDQPRHVYGTEIRSKVWRQNPETGAREPVVDADGRQAYRDQHVWHCSLSLSPGEGPLSGEQWDVIATDFADQMGFTVASGKAPARWVAIHHGSSKGGNDHVHFAASMVREDGTRWEGRLRDYPKSQAVCRDLERKYGLVEVDGNQYGTASKGARPVEQRIAATAGMQYTAREELAHRIRAAAVASTSEAEWIRRVRAEGVVIKPRFVAGSNDVVAGYRVALKTGEWRLNFYGGGQLGNDLSLPRVRENWPAPTLEQASAASAEWQAAFRGQTPTTKGREGKSLGEWSPNAPDVAAQNLKAFTDRLASVPYTDRVAWSDAARDAAGALSAWAKVDPAMADQLRSAAGVLARTAQDRRPGGQLGRRVKESPMGTSMILLAAGRSDKGKLAGAVLMAQLLRAAAAIRDYHQATRNLRQAEAVDQAVIRPLAQLQLHGYRRDPAIMTEAERARHIASQMNAPTPTPGSPLPNVLQARPQIGAWTDRREGRDGPER